MSRPLRGKQGCWTCKLRKKKCDEGKPKCQACQTLSVTCYGYGPKPEWMGDGDKEAAVLDEIKASVRLIPRRKPKGRAAETATPARLAPKATIISDESSQTGSQGNNTTPEASSSNGQKASPDDTAEQLSSLHIQDSSPDNEERTDLVVLPIIPQDSALLMQYLDHTFALQFPMYNPRFPDGGRGWLLTLLLHTAPLYHAALALGAYHRLLSNFVMAPPACRSAATFKHAHHFEQCLSNVQQAIREMTRFVSGSRELEIGTAMSVVQLVFLEMFTNPNGNWRIHLDGAIEMYERAIKDHIDQADTTKLNLRVLRGELPVEDRLAAAISQVDASRFVGGTVLWLDILASITAGSSPKLLSFHESALGPESSIFLEDIMGCKNIVMAQIGSIANLHAVRNDVSMQGIAACANSVAVVQSIETELTAALANVPSNDSSFADNMLHGALEDSSRNIAVVTSLFAHAANIYLHLVLHGLGESEALQDHIAKMMDIFRTQVSTKTLPALMFPLFMVGCAVSTAEGRDFVRSIFALPVLVNPLMKHRLMMLPTLEKIWRELSVRQVSWSDALLFSVGMLLL
ncbi:hypothetical protein CC79DRAFT_1370305 [Sarocladium strictum]